MSVISGVHSVVPFDSKKSSAFEGQRLCKVVYKKLKNGADKKASKCVSIPIVCASERFIDEGREYITAMYQAAQDGIVRGLVDSGKSEVTDAQVNDDAVLAWLAEEAAGNRLTKEAVEEWFAGNVAELLTVAFADKLGVSDTPSAEQEKQITSAVEQYKKLFSGLAGGKTSYDREAAVKLLRAMEVVGVEDDISGKFTARLCKMRDAPQGADMFGL